MSRGRERERGLRSHPSYAAGVLDCAGRFTIRNNGGAKGWQAVVTATVPRSVGEELLKQLGGHLRAARGASDRVVWHLPAKEQESALNRILPWLKARYEEAAAVAHYRRTEPKRVFAGKLPPAVGRYREHLQQALQSVSARRLHRDRQ